MKIFKAKLSVYQLWKVSNFELKYQRSSKLPGPSVPRLIPWATGQWVEAELSQIFSLRMRKPTICNACQETDLISLILSLKIYNQNVLQFLNTFLNMLCFGVPGQLTSLTSDGRNGTALIAFWCLPLVHSPCLFMGHGARTGTDGRRACIHSVWFSSGARIACFPSLPFIPDLGVQYIYNGYLYQGFCVLTVLHTFYRLKIDYVKYRSENSFFFFQKA